MLTRDADAAVHFHVATGLLWRDIARCAVLVALIFLAGALAGCASPAERFVNAYAQYRAEIGREHEENLDRILVPDVDETGVVKRRPLTDEEKARRRRAHAAADDAIAVARGGQ